MSAAASRQPDAAPLTVGAIVSNLRPARKGEGPATASLGTIACFALVNGRRDRRVVVLVANRHVLLANDAIVGAEIFAPPVSVDGAEWRVQARDAAPVARVSHEGLEGNHWFQYPGEPAGEYFVDAAAAELLPGVGFDPRRWPAGTPAETRVRGVGRMHPLDVSGTRRPRVRRLGGMIGAASGRVISATATVRDAAGRERRNVLAIRADDPASIQPGVSGALVVDERDRAVGVVWGRSEDDLAVAYACHIHPLLDRLGVTPLVGGFA